MILKLYYNFKLMRLITFKWLAKPIHAAVELKLADLISDRKVEINWLANKTNTKADLLYRLLRTLASVGIFKEVNKNTFISTPLAKLLKRDKFGSMICMFQSNWHDKAWNMLTKNIKTGIPGFELAHGCPAFTWFKNNKTASEIFNNANYLKIQMLSSILDNYKFNNIKSVTDIGGGFGALLIKILKKNIHLNGIVFDLENLQAYANKKIKEQNLVNRCKFVSGDFFNEIPANSDVYILCNILHDWNDDKCLKILKNCYNFMNKKSKLLIIEMIVPKGNKSSISKLMDLEVLIMGGGKERTKDEFINLLNTSNFRIKKIFPKKNNYNIIECLKK